MTTNQKDRKSKAMYSIISGGTASVLTQPLDVIKTVQLCNPNKSAAIEKSNSIKSLIEASKEIYRQTDGTNSFTKTTKGILNFFRGSSIGIFRQAFGFTIYSQILEELEILSKSIIQNRSSINNNQSGNKNNNLQINNNETKNNKINISYEYARTGVISGVSKVIAIIITCPLIVLKTRLELIAVLQTNKKSSISSEISQIVQQKGYFRGLNGVISRELSFSVFHYASFQFFKQFFIENHMFEGNTFIAPYIAGILGVVLSHPFEVVRNRMMISDANLPQIYRYNGLFDGFRQIIKNDGVVGFFNGLVPRLLRKPLNTGVSWGIYELLKNEQKIHQY